jgi:hypothetical protein
VNNEPGRRIIHKWGVRQGYPLSPMLFLLAMEPLHMLFRLAQNSRALGFLHDNCASFRMSLYVDNTTVFINLSYQDLATTKHLLQLFGKASGLTTNLEKN